MPFFVKTFCTRCGGASKFFKAFTTDSVDSAKTPTDSHNIKAAAALMAMGGVRDVYAFTLSRQAVEMLNARGIPWSCGEMVDHIVNRDGTGWCPMELCCRDCTTPDQCHAAIIKKIEEFKNKRQ